MSLPQPWYRKSKKAWYLQVARHTQKLLGRTKAEADAAYRQWLIENVGTVPATEQKKYTVDELAQKFLDHCKGNTKPKTYAFYSYFVVPFRNRFASAIAKDFLPLAFNEWLDGQKGWKSSRRHAIIAIKRMFQWAVENKLFKENPLQGVKKPKKKRRTRILSPAERNLIIGSIRDRAFREFFQAMLDTGCRPSEIMRLTATHVSDDGAAWVYDEHKTDRTGKPRIVYLTAPMQELTRRLIAECPDGGPLFRMFRGVKSKEHRYDRRVTGDKKPWTFNALRCRFRRLREKHPQLKGVTSYCVRHTYATHALQVLASPVVAALIGSSPRMIEEHYGHVDQLRDMLKQAAVTAVQRPDTARA